MDPSDLDSRYHKKGEDLDLAGNKLLLTDILMKQWGTRGVMFRNLADTEYRDILARSAIWTSTFEMYSGGRIRTSAGAGYNIRFQSYDTAFRTVMDMVGGYIDVSRAGDIIPVSDDTKLLGGPTKRFNSIYTKILAWDTGDLISYDKINNHMLFYINGVVQGYLDTDGFHNEAPP